MASKKKLLQAAAGSAGGAGLDVDEVFSTYLYDGTGSAQTITNGIDLDGEGGLVWIKRRDGTDWHNLYDTERGAPYYLNTNSTGAQGNGGSTYLTALNSNGFTVGSGGWTGQSGADYVSWTFRKAPKFFDVVTYSGNSQTSQTIAHSLGSAPGMMFVKRTDGVGIWWVYHRDVGATKFLRLQTTGAEETYSGAFNDTAPTATHFTVGSDSEINYSGRSYVAYLFAHNNNDGEFGPDGDQDIIKCGSYTGNGSTTGPTINLGFEPQWIMLKKTSSTQNAHWYAYDAMRGLVTGGDDPYLYLNSSAAEVAGNVLEVTPTGFQLKTGDSGFNNSSDTYIYMAIAHSICASSEPTSASDVFAIDTGSGTSTPMFTSNFPVDMAIYRIVDSSADFNIVSRLTGKQRLKTNSTEAESLSNPSEFDFMDGFFDGTSNLPTFYSWMWKRAPSYFDCLCYSGTGSNRTVSHNLGVVPEMMWIKRRNTQRDWSVYHSALGATKYIILNSNGTPTTVSSWWNDTEPTSSVFTTGASVGVNGLNDTYIAYLFASSTVSKVGSYTGTGSDLTVDCGFSARFVLIKCTSSTGNWFLFDTERGITSTTSPRLTLDTTDAESSSGNVVNPDNSGFIARPNFGLVNTLNEEYIFYAIA